MAIRLPFGSADLSVMDADLSVGEAVAGAVRQAAPRHEIHAPRFSRLFGAVVVALTFLLHSPGFVHEVVNADEASIGIQAEVVLHGGRLYHDVVDRKPPLVPYLYAATFFVTGSHDLRPVRLVADALLATTAVLVGLMAHRRSGRRAGVVAGLLFVFGAVALYPEDAQAANFEVFTLVPMTWALMAAERGRAGRAGLGLGIAVLCKQTAATTILPLAWLLHTRAARVRAAGVALAVFSAAAVASGVRPFLTWVVLGNGGYLGADAASLGLIARRLVGTAVLFGLGHASACVLAVRAARTRRADLHLWLWLWSGAVAAVAGFRFFGHYYLQLLPPLAVLAGQSAASLPIRRVQLLVGTAAVTAAAWTTAAFVPTLVEERPHWQRTAAYVAANTHPGDRVLVWGHLPEIAWSADRIPAGRLVHTDFLTGRSGGRVSVADPSGFAAPAQWTAFLSDLADHPPALIVDTAPAGIRRQDEYPLAAFPRMSAYLSAYLEDGWCRRAEIDRIAIYGPCGSVADVAPEVP